MPPSATAGQNFVREVAAIERVKKNPSMRAVWKKTSWTLLDTKLHVIPQRVTERRMERWSKRRAREHRRVASSKAEKVEPKGEAMEEERKVNVSTNSENLQKIDGQVDLGNGGQGSPDKLKPTV